MKRNLLFLCCSLLAIGVFGQSSWVNKPNAERGFVENLGQYDGRNWQSGNKIKYALSQQDGWFTFLQKKVLPIGLNVWLETPIRKKEKEMLTEKFLAEYI